MIKKPFECLRCNRMMQGASHLGGKDMHMDVEAVILCSECGNVMMMDKDMEPRAPTRRERAEMQAEGSIVIGLMALCHGMRAYIEQLHKERDAYAERASTIPGGCPPRD